MSSPIPGFLSWKGRGRSRSASILSYVTAPEHYGRTSTSNSDGGAGPEVDRSLQPGSDMSISSPRLSSSIGSVPIHREPIRSFIHTSTRDAPAPIDSLHNARTVREDTASLADYLLSDRQSSSSNPFKSRHRRSIDYDDLDLIGGPARGSTTIQELPEPASSEDSDNKDHGCNDQRDDGGDDDEDGPSTIANLLRKSPSPFPEQTDDLSPVNHRNELEQVNNVRHTRENSKSSKSQLEHKRDSCASFATEITPLLGRSSPSPLDGSDIDIDIEGQKCIPERQKWLSTVSGHARRLERRTADAFSVAVNPSCWNKRAIWEGAVVKPASCIPAVCVGLLLNILDALSYGMILFPLGKPIFAHLGSAGISIFYVSTIVSQITFSSGSIFKGAVGSELIEVVPFFHNMAYKITEIVGEDDPDAVIATTIVAFSISSIITGLVFYLMGRFKCGFMVGFIPRHILIGCIGGVGWFLLATGFEVSARMDGSLEYDLDTLYSLTRPDTILLWLIPLVLAAVLFYNQVNAASKYFLPLYILAIPMVFYFFVLSLDSLDADDLRDHGWIFDGPPANEPWWFFYTLFKMKLVRWDAILTTVPAMFALTFFGILHVPINVPTLALQCGEDNADLDKELKLHGYSNLLSGCLGSIQNYLVYANTSFFMRSGGDTRLAGYMLAVLTFGVMMIGPSIIGFIPVMMVSTLIFDLGFELLTEAVWHPRKKLKLAEYLTVIVIVLVMGIYDFVIGIGVGILLAFISLIVQTSRISAIRGSFSGDILTSTVRRNPSQHHFLKRVGGQIFIMKLTGYLFFGTIVSVEEQIRALLDNTAFGKKPIKFLVLDLWHVTGLDYSSGEVFNTISRLLDKKGIILILSGVDAETQIGRNLRAVGVGSNDIEVMMLPDLNSALESCENELLKTLYARQEEMNRTKRSRQTANNLDVPVSGASTFSSFDPPFNSPRRNHLVEAASDALRSVEVQRPKVWQSFKEPLRLLLQIFQGLSDKNEDFWFKATKYFKRRQIGPGTVLFKRGEQANGFYLVERGVLRSEYEPPHGRLSGSIVAGTTCGELPFFSVTKRTATVTAESECVVWLMDREGWERLQRDDPEVGRELLTVSLKLTSERMSSITSYTLTLAG